MYYLFYLKTVEIAAWIKKYDSSRLVNSIVVVIIVCAAMFGEYVVIDMVLKGHFWVPDKN